jgi:hypothetical protein
VHRRNSSWQDELSSLHKGGKWSECMTCSSQGSFYSRPSTLHAAATMPLEDLPVDAYLRLRSVPTTKDGKYGCCVRDW